MGLYDRNYAREGFSSSYGRPSMRMLFPSLTPIVIRLLIANGIIFLLQSAKPMDNFLTEWFAVYPASIFKILQVWRFIGYQFLHGSVTHILFNMLGLFFLGPTLERHWGGKRFLIFYLSCGVAGGFFYTLLAVLKILPVGTMIGASGAILGMLAACAILFPRFVVFIFVFPVPIRIAAAIFTFLYIVNLLKGGPNAGGDSAHLAGMAAGAAYVLWQPWFDGFAYRQQRKKSEMNLRQQQSLQAEVDRILDKVNDSGIRSLTRREKKILEHATQQEQARSKM